MAAASHTSADLVILWETLLSVRLCSRERTWQYLLPPCGQKLKSQHGIPAARARGPPGQSQEFLAIVTIWKGVLSSLPPAARPSQHCSEVLLPAHVLCRARRCGHRVGRREIKSRARAKGDFGILSEDLQGRAGALAAGQGGEGKGFPGVAQPGRPSRSGARCRPPQALPPQALPGRANPRARAGGARRPPLLRRPRARSLPPPPPPS